MIGKRHVVALAAVLALAGANVIVAAPQRPNRVGDQQVGDLLNRLDASIAAFRVSFEQAIDRSGKSGSRAKDDIGQSVNDFKQAVNDFKQAADRLRDRVQNRQAGATDVEDLLRRASSIDGFIASRALGAAAERDWRSLRDNLDELARVYGVAWNWTGSQTAASRLGDQQIGQLLARTSKDAGRFRRSLDRAVDRSRIDRSREDNNINQFVKDFAETANHLSDHFDRRQVVTSDIEEVLRRSVSIDSFMQRHQLADQAEKDWLSVRRDLDDLAHAYNVTWNWSNPRYTGDERRTGLYHRLTGTYQLESSRSDDPRKAAEQAVRTLSSDQRQRTYQRLMNRLNAPEAIAIDRNQNTVTMASSRGPRLTFEADGQVRTEQGHAGRTVNTRATLHGDQLVMTTTGDRGHDFAVTFEPIGVRRAVFGEPLLAHPAERRGVQAARQPHFWDGHDRDQHDDDTKGKQHVVLACNQVPSCSTILTLLPGTCLCACAHGAACLRERHGGGEHEESGGGCTPGRMYRFAQRV